MHLSSCWRSAWWIGRERERMKESALRKHFNSPGQAVSCEKASADLWRPFYGTRKYKSERASHGCYIIIIKHIMKSKSGRVLYFRMPHWLFMESRWWRKRLVNEWVRGGVFICVCARAQCNYKIHLLLQTAEMSWWWSCKSHALTDWNVADVTALIQIQRQVWNRDPLAWLERVTYLFNPPAVRVRLFLYLNEDSAPYTQTMGLICANKSLNLDVSFVKLVSRESKAVRNKALLGEINVWLMFVCMINN